MCTVVDEDLSTWKRHSCMSSVTLRQRFALHLRGEVPCIAVAMLVDPRTYELTGIDAEISGTMN